VKDASKYRANRIVFDSDSDDDTEAVDDQSRPVEHVQSDKQVFVSSHSALYVLVFKTWAHPGCSVTTAAGCHSSFTHFDLWKHTVNSFQPNTDTMLNITVS